MTNFPHATRRRLHVIAMPLALVLASLVATPVAAAPARHAVVVVIDGGRNSETLGDTLHRWCARQALDLAPQGGLVTNFRNEGVTVTMPGTSAVMCGLWQPLANDGSEPSHVPSLLESWRIATGAPASDTWLVATKSKILTLAQSSHAASSAATRSATLLCADDVAAAVGGMQVLDQYHPTLLVLQLGDPDVIAHTGNWTLYTAALRQADSLVAVLWQTIQSDPALADSTALFVTNDHGRHLDSAGGFESHGDDCEGCRHIYLLALGAGLKSGVVSPLLHRQIDIAPTIGTLLGFATPWTQGVVMDDLLAPETPLAVGAGAPLPFRLGAPAPNPSRGSVGFTLELAADANTRIEVFDLQGRRVAQVFSGRLGAGTHRLAWNGRDARGRTAAAGTYLLRAGDGRTSDTMPIVRLR